MAEIKSTLDLIMEKTDHLTLTEDEKEVIRRTEQSARVKGWIQRYEDKTIRADEIKKDLNASLKDLLRREILERFEPASSNETLYQMLEDVLGIGRDPFETVAERFRRTIDSERQRRRAGGLADLAAVGISGSAVIPNPEGSREWKLFHDTVREAFRAELLALP